MDRGSPRRQAGFNSRRLHRPDRVGARPDRIAFWAFVLAVVALCVAAATAAAAGGPGSGGVGTTPPTGSCADVDLGERELSRGDCGTDVLTLNWILNSKEFGIEAGLGDEFDNATEDAVRSLQDVADISRSGVVDEETRAALIKSMRKDGASWYGPGLYGNSTACGQKFTRRLVGVAHKTLPCGTKVVLKYKGTFLRTEVVDRGPYIKGRRWDLTYAAQQKLQIPGVATIRSAIVRP